MTAPAPAGFSLELTAAVMAAQGLFPLLVDTPGATNAVIGGDAATSPVPHTAPLSVPGAGLLMLTRALAAEQDRPVDTNWVVAEQYSRWVSEDRPSTSPRRSAPSSVPDRPGGRAFAGARAAQRP